LAFIFNDKGQCRMRSILSLAILLALPLAAHAQTAEAQQDDEVVIEGIGLSQTIPCEGRNIGIYGSGNKIGLTGDCGDVLVHGSTHEVSIETAKAVTISGADHTVFANTIAALSVETTGHVVTATLSGDPAEVAVNGADQTLNLTLASATDISVGGTEQVVNWSLADGTPEPRIEIGGIDNAVNRIQ
jgi:hypothetical protein